MSKKRTNISGIVYSTDPAFQTESEESPVEITPEPKDQLLRIRLETKHRAGKAVTVITGFVGTPGDLEKLGKILKTYCGTGGSVKDGEIIVQGDNREKILSWMQKNGYTKSKKQ